jgi:hypothetical protein
LLGVEINLERKTVSKPLMFPEPNHDIEAGSSGPISNQPGDRSARGYGNILPAFWTIASLLSILVNIILIVLVFILASELFNIKRLVQVQLIDGLYNNFAKMDEARISTTIHVKDIIKVQDTIPVIFDLPLKQGTEITLTRDTPIRKAIVYLNGQPVPTDITLRQGTRMSIALDMIVPVSQTIPIELDVPVDMQVPVDIPLYATELHEPFAGLMEVVAPYKKALDNLPDSWEELLCKPFHGWPCE